MKKAKKAIGLLLCFSICFTSTVFAAQDSQNIPLSTDEKITQNELSPSNEVTDITINEQNSDVISRAAAQSGQWIQAADGRWWYRHSDGSYTTNNWELINGKWYYFDAQGWMVVGWIQLGGTWYYLDPSSGAMVTGWLLSGSKWYYLSESGAMVTGWLQLGSNWYYLDSTGAMLTGWQHITYSGLYQNKAYWNYFNSSGAFVTDSDVRGCSHGYSNYSEHKCIHGCNLKYCISTSKKSASDIRTAAKRWNNTANCPASLTEGSGSLNCHINVTSSTSFDSNTLGITYFFYQGNTTKPQNTNWSGCQIDLNEKVTTTISTITHEFGHAFGLSHRISDKYSIMCQTGQGRKAESPSAGDASGIDHLY